MTIEEVYIKTLVKVNKNLNSNNITLDKQRFILMYNEEQIRRIVHVLNHENNDDGIREIQYFLKANNELNKVETLKDRDTFSLPSDYLDISSGYCEAKKGKCVDKVYLWEIKDKNYTEKLSDNNNKPSFDFRETPYIVADNKLQIFKEDFSIEKANLTYYRYPKEVDMLGYININNTNSVEKNPEGDNKFINTITSMIAESYATNYGDTAKVQLENRRINTNT